VPEAVFVSQVAALTTITSPFEGINDGVTRELESPLIGEAVK
jgi:hypothetical protein